MSIYLTHQMLDPTPSRVKPTMRSGILSHWSRSLIRRWRRRKMIAALHALDDRMLLDVGIKRADIKRLVEGFDDRQLRMAPMEQAEIATRQEDVMFPKAA